MSKPPKTKRISPQITITVLPELAEHAEQRAEQLGKQFGVRANMSAYIGWLIRRDKERCEQQGEAGQASAPSPQVCGDSPGVDDHLRPGG